MEKDEAPKRCDFLRLRNMLLKATFPSSYLGLVEATPAAKKKWVFFGTACSKFMSVKNNPLTQQCIIYSTPSRRTVHAYSPSNAATTPAKNRLKLPSAWQTSSNCRHFHDNLYQAQLSGCSALPESRRQSLPNPYAGRRTKFAPVKSLDSSGRFHLMFPEIWNFGL